MGYQKALTSDVKVAKHCAIILDKEYNILTYFVNDKLHAEDGAIKQIGNCPEAKYILVVRGNMLGNMTLSKPCLECYKSIKTCESIEQIIYTTGTMKFEIVYI